MPTALARPWPSGPVVISTPAVWPYSGWPGVSEPQCRKCLQVVQLQAETGEVELDVQGQARSGRRTGRNGPGRPTAGRPGRAAGAAGRAGRPPGPGTSRSRGGRSRRSGPRPWPGRGRCPRRACPSRSTRTGLRCLRCSPEALLRSPRAEAPRSGTAGGTPAQHDSDLVSPAYSDLSGHRVPSQHVDGRTGLGVTLGERAAVRALSDVRWRSPQRYVRWRTVGDSTRDKATRRRSA